MGVRKNAFQFLVLIIFLILITISIASAQTTVVITGENGVAGIRGTDDITQVTVKSDGPVSIIQGDKETEMSCTEKSAENFECEYTFSKAILQAKEHTLSFKQTLPAIKKYNQKFIVDGEAPIIAQFEIKETPNKLDLTLIASDDAYPSATTCAGIKKIDITTESDVVYTEIIEEAGKCEYEKIELIDPPRIFGETTFTLTVEDQLGQTTTTTFGPLDLDFKGPEIKNEITITSGNKTLTKIAARATIVPKAEVHVYIEDDDLLLVTGDVSSLSNDPRLKAIDSARTAECSKTEDNYDCVFEHVNINPETVEVSIPIYAEDEKGHITTKNATITFEVQTQESEITFFGRLNKHCFEEFCYYKEGLNELHLNIKTEDVEIVPELITISGSDLSTLDVFSPEVCNETDEHYDCIAQIPVDGTHESGEEHNIVITSPSTDILGAPLTGITKTRAKLDFDTPEKTPESDLNISVSCPIAGEKAYLTINATDKTSPILRIKTTTERITIETHFEKDCQKQGNIFVCTLPLSGFVSYAENEKIIVVVEDLAGNNFETEFEINVCEAQTDSPPEMITKINPILDQKIDIRMLSFMSLKAYIPLEIDFKSPEVKIIDLDTDGCVKTKGIGGRPYFIDKYGKNPVLAVPLSKGTYPDDKVNINCTIKVYQQRGTVRFTKPEEEILSVQVPTFNQPLGTITDGTQAKLDGILNEIQDLQTSIDSWHKYLDVIDMICTTTGTLTDLFSRISAIESVLYPIFIGLYAIPQTKDTAKQTWDKTCKFFKKIDKWRNGVWKTGKTTGKAPSAGIQKLTLSATSFYKVGCLIHNCGLCSPGGVYQGINIVGSAVNQWGDINKQKVMDELQTAEKDSNADLKFAEEKETKLTEEKNILQKSLDELDTK